VYNRVASGEPIFSDPEEAAPFIETIRETKERVGWTVLAWCVMSNHYHLVIRTATVPLWRGMHRVQNLFSRRFNIRHGRTGSLWQSRYKAKLLEDEDYLDRLVVYVHLNPVQAGIADDPGEYPFSGHREVRRRIKGALVDTDEMLLCFGTTKKEARRVYLGAVRAGVAPEEESVRLRWHPFASLQDEPLEIDETKATIDHLGRSTDLERSELDVEVFVELVCGILAVDVPLVSSRLRDRSTATARRLIVTLGIERWRQNRTELARVLRKNPDVVSWWAGEGAARRMEDAEFASQLDRMDQELARRASKMTVSERLNPTS
jgi:REP element-mobilizing transposase RayT